MGVGRPFIISVVRSYFTAILPLLEFIQGIFYLAADFDYVARREASRRLFIPPNTVSITPVAVYIRIMAARLMVRLSWLLLTSCLEEKECFPRSPGMTRMRMTAVMIELCRSDMGDDIDIMTSLRGIGEKTAANFLIEMGGDIRKFKDHKKLITMAGIDPAIYQSGKHDGQGRITKRGNRHLRRVIWLMTIRVIQFNDCFRQHYQKRRTGWTAFQKGGSCYCP